MDEQPVSAFMVVPSWYWGLCFFMFGSITGSFLNVCIYRMPLEKSIITPRSHCPHCGYMIPWFLNIPLVTWLYLRGKCANCSAPISVRYFLVELLTGVAFLSCWVAFGDREHPVTFAVALSACLLLAGFITATFIDFEHFIIPNEITLGGAAVGFVVSMLVPEVHHTGSRIIAMQQSFLGIVAGSGIVYAVLRMGKLLFGREQVVLPENTKVVFTETALVLPDQQIPYEDMFYRRSDTLVLEAKTLELVDRCYKDVKVRLSPAALEVGDEEIDPAGVHYMEAVTSEVLRPREAMGLGDVKFMAAIGAFLGWPAVIFSLLVSAVIGSVVGISLIAIGRSSWSSRLPYGPYIAIAATIWLFYGVQFMEWWVPKVPTVAPVVM